MADTETNEAKVSIKLIVDKVKKRVMYAEADYTFVDILFSFMTLPLGTIVRALGKVADKELVALGSLTNLYQSLKDFPECYLSTEECKFLLLNPRSCFYNQCRGLKLKIDDTEPRQYFRCERCWSNDHSDHRFVFSTCSKARCISCGLLMNELHFWGTTVYVHGSVFVSHIATFIVTDDFTVIPYTAATSIRLLRDLGITDTSHLEERKLEIGCEQVKVHIFFFHMLTHTNALSSKDGALTLDSPLTYLVFNKNVRGFDADLGLVTAFDHFNIMKKETSSGMSLLLEVSLQKSTGKVLFAEAKEDFVEFLFGCLSIPLGTVIGTLMNGASSISCMDNLFKSISSMGVGRYLKSQDLKDNLLKPPFGQHYTSKHQLFPLTGTLINVPVRIGFKYLTFKDPRVDEIFLKQAGSFFVTDDLVITPSSSSLTLNILNKFKVPLDDIERYEISIGLEEGLRMLKASLRSRETLTNSLPHHLIKRSEL
ncbi:hypothetical protein QVD17_27656 [Tagetes erecta]|uniref:DUF674 family protein n=1 Tax=Tagetes erecta TaxID=13708 RepID=A0AAD8KCB3_TARER|nr:hypothetical protein QVD17_27656 [Tagetes erecta]